jgi:hypothetical protein
MRIRNRKSRQRRVAEAIGTYLKFKAIAKAARAAKAVVTSKKTRKAVKEAPTVVKAAPVVAGVGVAGAAVAVRKRRQDGASSEVAEREPVAA